ncbi:MAG TPA: malto-oligosyltrehalose synthase [Gaiellaceae bacterium]|nr:malto-oligosyltrehalose synthase [Gaiellaceae bacterium]
MTERPLHCTYRLQLLPHLDFRAARELVPYLRDLGVSHLYLSPAMQARSGSTHGYDVVDPTHLSEELGGEDEFRSLCEAGLGVILDVVPNHMAASDDENPFWRDPLRRAKFFDVEWRTGGVRRFFDIGDLAGLRMEDPEVFEATHAKVIELVREGLVDGIRIDHPDGLANPARYLNRLREAGVEQVWVEKILEPGEQLRDWPVCGTTGYEFANDATALFLDPTAEEPLTELYREISGEERSFGEIALEAKLEQARTTFEPEVDRLAADIAGLDEELDLPRALASFHVYRTYVDPDSGEVDGLDRQAVADARLPPRLAALLTLEERGHDAFVIRFQQTTPPVMAKGVEDTAFYRYNRLLCLNEVGSDPARWSLSVDDFHAGNLERARRFPRHLLATSTHDTKRSGDVRARLAALTWIADEWRENVLRWRELLRHDGPPGGNEEYFVYQTLAGAWPIDDARVDRYLEKALREAKVHTSWLEPDEAYETAVKEFAHRAAEHVAPFAERLAELGERIALAQTLLKLTCPGVPDLYQGDELWNLTLVDPDNREPVDWERRRTLLTELRAGAAPTRETLKLFLIWKTLELRAERPEAFRGTYAPLDRGPDVCAFQRGGEVLVAVALTPGAEVAVPHGWRDVLGGAVPGCLLGIPAT